MDFHLTRAFEILERTPAVFRGLLDGLPAEWTHADEGPETFSAFDNVGHLVWAERTDWIPRARVILSRTPDASFPPFDRFGHYDAYEGWSLAALLDEFARIRHENLGIVRDWKLTPADLALEGTHPAFGRVTLAQLLATWVAHDLGHLAQTSRVLAKQYCDAVGPWREYLPILDR